MDDKKQYKAVQKLLNSTASVASILNRLNEILIDTEDEHLKKMLAGIEALIRGGMTRPTERIHLGSIGKTHVSPAMKSLTAGISMTNQYCQAMLESEQKQWEILALRAGWSPPAKN